MFDWSVVLQVAGGILAGIVAGKQWGNSTTGKIVKIFVDTINEIGVVIGEKHQKEVKKAIQRNSLRIGMKEAVHKAVKKAEKRNAK